MLKWIICGLIGGAGLVISEMAAPVARAVDKKVKEKRSEVEIDDEDENEEDDED